MDDSKFDKAKGNVKETAGDLTGNEDLEREGKMDRAGGKAKEKAEKAKDKVSEGVDKVKEKFRRD
jgi:uncharacterized protein YjbJ (UPF0337 family)